MTMCGEPHLEPAIKKRKCDTYQPVECCPQQDLHHKFVPSTFRQQSVSSSCGASSEQPTDATSPCDDSGSDYSETDSDTSSVDYESEVFGCWWAKQKLSSGNNGQVYVGELLDSSIGVRVALKIEKRSLRHSHLKTELKVFDKLRGLTGFPRIFDYGKLSKTLWMAMELLGPSLRSLHSRYKFDEDLVLFLGEQMLERMQALHSQGYVHLSVKPDNFCLQEDDQGKVIVHLIDFGRCEKIWKDSGEHITFKNNKGGPFSRWYHSAGALKGKRQSRRDDLQSLAYCLVMFTIGESFMDWREDLDDPCGVDVAEHFRDKLPAWLYQFTRYCLDLQWAEAPDYDGLRKLMRARRTAAGEASAVDLCQHAIRKHFKKFSS